jgi:hypothetical protein
MEVASWAESRRVHSKQKQSFKRTLMMRSREVRVVEWYRYVQ